MICSRSFGFVSSLASLDGKNLTRCREDNSYGLGLGAYSIAGLTSPNWL